MSSHGGGVADASPYLGSILPVVMFHSTGSGTATHRPKCSSLCESRYDATRGRGWLSALARLFRPAGALIPIVRPGAAPPHVVRLLVARPPAGGSRDAPRGDVSAPAAPPPWLRPGARLRAFPPLRPERVPQPTEPRQRVPLPRVQSCGAPPRPAPAPSAPVQADAPAVVPPRATLPSSAAAQPRGTSERPSHRRRSSLHTKQPVAAVSRTPAGYECAPVCRRDRCPLQAQVRASGPSLRPRQPPPRPRRFFRSSSGRGPDQ